MRHFDLSPLYRSTVGFDRMFSLLDQLATPDAATPGYPPYNIERTGESAYRITMAVAGFGEKDISIEVIAEVFNIFDDENPAGFVGALNSPNFDQPSTFAGDQLQGEQRVGQIGVRLRF